MCTMVQVPEQPDDRTQGVRLQTVAMDDVAVMLAHEKPDAPGAPERVGHGTCDLGEAGWPVHIEQSLRLVGGNRRAEFPRDIRQWSLGGHGEDGLDERAAEHVLDDGLGASLEVGNGGNKQNPRFAHLALLLMLHCKTRVLA